MGNEPYFHVGYVTKIEACSSKIVLAHSEHNYEMGSSRENRTTHKKIYVNLTGEILPEMPTSSSIAHIYIRLSIMLLPSII